MVPCLVENLSSNAIKIQKSLRLITWWLFNCRATRLPRSYLDVYKILWAVLFNFCFKEDKVAALPGKENFKNPNSAQEEKAIPEPWWCVPPDTGPEKKPEDMSETVTPEKHFPWGLTGSAEKKFWSSFLHIRNKVNATQGLGGEFPSCPVAGTWHFHYTALVQSLLGVRVWVFWEHT